MNSKQESLDDILYLIHPKHKGGECLRLQSAKRALQAYCKRQVIEELEKVLKTKRQPIMMIGTPFADGVVSSKAITDRIKELKEKE